MSDEALISTGGSDHSARGFHNPLVAGSVLTLAQSVSTHRLTADEIQAVDTLAQQIHQRLEATRAVPHQSAEYAQGSWLLTRAYIARALEFLPLRHSDSGASSSSSVGSYGVENKVPIERLFRFFALESLVLDPVRTIYPLQLPQDLDVETTPSQWRKFKPDWEAFFSETFDYLVYLPEGLYSQVHGRMQRAFPDGIAMPRRRPGHCCQCDSQAHVIH